MLMTVKEYAEYTGLSIPAVYKQIRLKKLKNAKSVNKYGKMLIKVSVKSTP